MYQAIAIRWLTKWCRQLCCLSEENVKNKTFLTYSPIKEIGRDGWSNIQTPRPLVSWSSHHLLLMENYNLRYFTLNQELLHMHLYYTIVGTNAVYSIHILDRNISYICTVKDCPRCCQSVASLRWSFLGRMGGLTLWAANGGLGTSMTTLVAEWESTEYRPSQASHNCTGKIP